MLKRIILHWTAGTYYPNHIEKEHYHFLIDAEGNIHEGIYKPEDNINCYDGKYAAHTGGGNTGSIGIALCGMFKYPDPEFKDTPFTLYPLTKVQCEAAFNLVAGLCLKYKLKINKDTVFTHYEFGKRNAHTSSAGKIDIKYLPAYPEVKEKSVGNFIRDKAQWYYSKRLRKK